MDLADVLSSENVFTFLLLLLRVFFIFTFMPIFSYKNIPVVIKATFAFYMTIIIYPTVRYQVNPVSIIPLVGMILSEAIFVFIAGFLLRLAIDMLASTGQYISFVMGFSMATMVDPTSGTRVDIFTTFLSLLAILILMSLNGHYLIIEFIVKSIDGVKLGSFYLNENMVGYAFKAISSYFIIGASLAFPVLVISFILDIIFGMLMKTMPQFNVLVIGYPIKIGFAMLIVVAILGGIGLLLKKEYLEKINYLLKLI